MEILTVSFLQHIFDFRVCFVGHTIGTSMSTCYEGRVVIMFCKMMDFVEKNEGFFLCSYGVVG